MPDAPAKPRAAEDHDPPRFVAGSTLRHVAVMTATGSIGLIAIFVVDLFSLLYISWLGDPRLTAGVGFATIVLFFGTSINVGLMIAAGALVARALGARNRDRARRIAASASVHMVLVAALVAAVLLSILPWLLERLGAGPETLPSQSGSYGSPCRRTRRWRSAWGSRASCAPSGTRAAPCT